MSKYYGYARALAPVAAYGARAAYGAARAYGRRTRRAPFARSRSTYGRSARMPSYVHNSNPGNLQGIYENPRAFRPAPRGQRELKFYDNVGCTQAASATIQVPAGAASGAPLVGLAQGVTESQRVGRKVFCKNLQIIGTIQMVETTAAVASASDIANLWVVLDRQANGAFPAAADIWNTTNVGGTQAFRNLDNDTRFRVLKHCQFEFRTPAANATPVWGDDVKTIDISIPLQGLSIEYNAAAGAIAELKETNLLICTTSLNGLCNFTFATRLRYHDTQ